MFKAFGRLLSYRKAPASSFAAPKNSDMESVAAFEASLAAKGLNEAERGEIMVARAVAGMLYLRTKGYSFEQIDDMPPARYLSLPTDPREYDVYRECAKRQRQAAKLRMTLGLP